METLVAEFVKKSPAEATDWLVEEVKRTLEEAGDVEMLRTRVTLLLVAWSDARNVRSAERSFEDDEEGAGVAIVADPRMPFRPAVPYFDCSAEPLNMLVTTDLQYPIWIVRYDTWRDEQKCGERRDARWLNQVVVARFDLREVAWLAPWFSCRRLEQWKWMLCTLKDAQHADVDEHLRSAARDALDRLIVPPPGDSPLFMPGLVLPVEPGPLSGSAMCNHLDEAIREDDPWEATHELAELCRLRCVHACIERPTRRSEAWLRAAGILDEAAAQIAKLDFSTASPCVGTDAT